MLSLVNDHPNIPDYSRGIAGIGFIGGGAILGGAILKDGRTVIGTATADSLWNTGVMGAAVGFGLYDIGAVLSVINLATLRLLAPFKKSQSDGEI